MILTGSDEPSNQDVNLPTAPILGLACWSESLSTNLDRDVGRSGDSALDILRKGRKLEDRVGETEGVLLNNGGSSTVVLDR